MHQPQALFAVQGEGRHAQPLEVPQDIGLNAIQPGLGCADALCLDAEGQILGLLKSPAALGHLGFQDGEVFPADLVKLVPLERHPEALSDGLLPHREIEEGELEVDGAIKVVEEVSPAFKDGCLVLVLVQLIIDVQKLNGLGVILCRNTADAVRPHPLVGNALLGGCFFAVRAVGSGNGIVDALSLAAGEIGRPDVRLLPGTGTASKGFSDLGQYAPPPPTAPPDEPGRHRRCRCGTAGSGGAAP